MKKYFILAAAALAMVACSNDESENNAVAQSDVISFTAGMANDEVTRAAVDIQGAAFAAGEDVKIEVTPSGGSMSSAIYTTAAASEGKNALSVKAGSTAFTWPANGTVAIKAFYPSSVTSSTASFSVEENQSTDPNYKASDLMYATPIDAQAKQAGAVGLTFNHALTKIIVNLTAGTGVTDDDIAACTVTLSAKKTAAITSGVAGNASGDAATITMGTGANNAAIIVPQSITASNESKVNFITITTQGGHSKTYQLTANKAFAAGKVYTYNLTVKMSEIVLESTTISNWDPQAGDTQDVVI